MADVVKELLQGKRRRPPQSNVVRDLLRGRPAEAAEPAASPSGGFMRTLDDVMRSIASGATFGFADEIAAGMASATGIGGQAPAGDYESALQAERARDIEIPTGARLPGQIAGGIASTVAAAPVTAPIAGAKMIAALPGWIRAAGLGGVYGALFGAGEAEGGLQERATAAATGGVAGAATGAVLHPVISGVTAGASKVGEAVRTRFAPKVAAQTKLAEAIARDEQTPARVATELQRLGPQATIADAGGRNVQGLARAAAGVPGPAAGRAERVLTERAEGEATRIAEAVKRGLDPQDYYAAEDAFLRNMRERAGPVYQEAYAAHQSLTNPALERLLSGKVGQAALREAAFITEAERASGVAAYLGAVDVELTAAARFAQQVGKLDPAGVPRPGVLRGLSLKTWDHIKRGFDALLDKPAYRNELTGRLSHRGKAVDQMRRTLIKELDKETGGAGSVYARARGLYAGEAEALGALRDGRKAMSLDPEIIMRQIGALSDAGKEAYRAGAARAMKDVVDQTPDLTSAARRLFGKSRNRDRLRAVFPDEQSYQTLARTLMAESLFAKTRNFVLGGPPTAEKLAGQADLLTKAGGVAGVMLGQHLPGHPLLAASLGRKFGQALIGPRSEKYNVELARTLFNRDQTLNQGALQKLMDRKAWQLLPKQAKRRLGDALLLAITQQEGRAAGQAQQP